MPAAGVPRRCTRREPAAIGASIALSQPERQFVSYSMLTGLLGGPVSNGKLALISTPAAKAAMARTANMPSKSGVNTPTREIRERNVLRLLEGR